jgi:hypothetical protein
MNLTEMQKQRADEAEAQLTTEFEAKQWQAILLRWPNIQDCEANFYICQQACRPLDITVDGIALLLDDESPVGLVHQLSLGNVDTIKRELIEQIVEYLDGKQSPNPETDRYTVQNRRKVMAFWSLDALRQEAYRLKNVAALQGKSRAELRDIIKQNQSATTGYPALPTTIVRPGSIKPIPLSGDYIKRLDREDLKKMIRLYGCDSVNQRLAEG